MSNAVDIADLIGTAKIGSERRAAQSDSCAPFAAALYDVLAELGLEPKLAVACHRGHTVDGTWYHQVVELAGRYYDSLGEFSLDILRKRLKIHPKAEFDLTFQPEPRAGCFEEEDYEVLHGFLVKELRKAAAKQSRTKALALDPFHP